MVLILCFLYKESNEYEMFKLTEELEELKITNESLQRVSKDVIASSVTYLNVHSTWYSSINLFGIFLVLLFCPEFSTEFI